MTNALAAAGLLSDLRIADITGVFGAYASRLLTDHGATVVRIAVESGDPADGIGPHDPSTGESYFGRFVNAGKRSVRVPPERMHNPAFLADVLDWCDVLIEELPTLTGIDDAAVATTLREHGSKKIVVSIRPFAEGSQMEGSALDDLSAQALGGLMSLTGHPQREPLALYGGQAHYIVGVFAASAALIGLGDSGGPSGLRHYLVSVQEAIVHSLETAVQYYTTEGVVRSRKGAAQQAGDGSYRARDGRVVLGAMTDLEWGRLSAWLSKCGIADGRSFATWDLEQRRDPGSIRRFTEVFEAFAMTRDCEWLVIAGQANQVLISPSYRISDILADSQLTYDQFFRSVGDSSGRSSIYPGAPYRISNGIVQVREGARRPGEDNEWFFGKCLAATKQQA